MRAPFQTSTWLESEVFLGQTVTFTSPVYSRWRLIKRIHVRDYSFIEDQSTQSDEKSSINNVKVSIDQKESKDKQHSFIDTQSTQSNVKVLIDHSLVETKPMSDRKLLDDKNEAEAQDRPANAAAPAAEEEGGGGRTETRRYESCAVYKCIRLDNKNKNARPADQTGQAGLPRVGIMKVRIQIPSPDTATGPTLARRPQATTTLTRTAVSEIKALTTLTTAKCTSTPHLLAWKQGKQGSDSGVPGGYIVYVVMGMLPGVRIGNVFRELGREERDEFRRGFKEAWLECSTKGVINLDTALRNLLWDAEKKKCYILDFEFYRKPTEEDTWKDSHYLAWDLAYLNQGDPNDTSTWDL